MQIDERAAVPSASWTDPVDHAAATYNAKSKITLNSGGASVVIENGNITFHCPGAYAIRAASFIFVGPDNVPTPLPSLPKASLKISDQ